MTKTELDLLERAFDAEIRSALEPHRLPLIQTRSKVARKLVDDGLLYEVEHTLGGRFPIKVRGFALTHAGRYAYCSSPRCADAEDDR